jgi:NADH-quinone oxidoreductase subunit A
LIESYIPILGVLGFGVLTAGAFMALSYIISLMQGQNKPDPIKYTTYECGIPPKTNARQRFTVGFYLIALDFIIFDVEAALLYPWAHDFHNLVRETGPTSLIAMLVFTVFIVVALAYLWKEGTLDWARRARTQGRETVN